MHIRTLMLFILAASAPAAWAHGQGVHTHDAGLLAGFVVAIAVGGLLAGAKTRRPILGMTGVAISLAGLGLFFIGS